MYITLPYRSSSAIQSLEVDALKGLANVKFKNGNEYEYENVSKLAIINVLFNEDVSLGFWVNNQLVNSEKAGLRASSNRPGSTFTRDLNNKQRARLEAILKDENELKLPEFA